MEAETTALIMCCHFYNSNQTTLTIDRENIPISFSMVSDNNLISLVLFARDKFDDTKNEKKKMVHRGLMSNVSDNLQACYTYTVIFTCQSAKSFLLPFQRASFICYFTLGIFL